ncbi:MAG: hypothetical protein IJ955_07955 [Oscillospiraceae bacterium]|nr:hypothetical protein [Oscillospiraceae bacterium]
MLQHHAKSLRTAASVFFLMLLTIFVVPSTAEASSYTLAVGETKTIFLNASESGVMNCIWEINDSSGSISIVSSSNTSCTIRANKQPILTPLILSCQYLYPKQNGSYTYYISGYKSFSITVSSSSSSDGSTGVYKLYAPSTSITVDLANRPSYFTLTSGVSLSDTVYVDENSYAGNVLSLAGYTEGNKVHYGVYPQTTGRQSVKFQLMTETSPNFLTIKHSITISFTVICTHRYSGAGTIIKEPTFTETGSAEYSCIYCSHTKTETLPVLVPHTEFSRGNPALDDSTGEFSCDVFLKNVTLDALETQLIVATYKDDVLKNISFHDISLASCETVKHKVVLENNINLVYKFFWLTPDTFSPLNPHLELSLAT